MLLFNVPQREDNDRGTTRATTRPWPPRNKFYTTCEAQPTTAPKKKLNFSVGACVGRDSCCPGLQKVGHVEQLTVARVEVTTWTATCT